MKIYLAGAIKGNLKNFWSTTCKRLNQGEPFEIATDKAMKLFLTKNKIDNADISGKSTYPIAIQRRNENTHLINESNRGGIFNKVNNESISSRNSVKTVDTQTNIHGRGVSLT